MIYGLKSVRNCSEKIDEYETEEVIHSEVLHKDTEFIKASKLEDSGY